MGIPDSIKQKPFFVGWGYFNRNGNQTKTPINPHTGKFAKSNDPATWGTFEQANNAVSKYHIEGVGIMFAKENGIVGVDIDHCYDPEAKQFNDTASAILERCRTYTEFSPSGKGLHLYFLAEDKPAGGSRNANTCVEMYSRARFFTLTENQVENTPDEIKQDEGELQWILDTFIEKQKKQPKKEKTYSKTYQFADDEILSRAKASSNGQKFSDLIEGRWQSHYGSQSEADLALCTMLAFWTGRNKEQIDRIFRASNLMRPKWDERHSSSGATYGDDTVSKACESCEDTYSPAAEGPILESSGCYVRCRGEAVYPITNFTCIPQEQIITPDEDQLTAVFVTRGERLTLTFMSSDFSSTQKFKGMLNRNTISLSFDGGDSDLEALKVYLSNLKWNRKAGVKSLGLHEHEGQWVFVDCDGAMAKNIVAVENIVQLSRYRSIRTDLLSHKKISKEALSGVLKNLMEYNEPAKTIPILGWCAGAFLKARLTKLGIKFPHLALIGEAGSGKSSTLERVIMPVFGCDKATAASQVTPFTLMRESASSNLMPQFIDEFKPSKLSDARTSALYNHFRDVYDGHDGQRGRADQSIAVYELTAPIVFAGEESPQEAAIRERTIQTLFSKKDLKESSYRRALNSLASREDGLKDLGFTLLLGALEIRDAVLEAWHEMGMNHFPEEFPPRVVNNLSCCFVGIMFLKEICGKAYGIDWDKTFPYSVNECADALTYSAREYLLDGGMHNRSAVEEALEIMSRIPTLVYKQDYAVNETEGLLMLHFPDVYDKYTRYRREYDIKGEVLTYNEFSRQLQHSDLFLQKGKQVFHPDSRKNTKMWVLNLDLLSSRCDVSSFLEHRNEGGFYS